LPKRQAFLRADLVKILTCGGGLRAGPAEAEKLYHTYDRIVKRKNEIFSKKFFYFFEKSIDFIPECAII